MHTQLHGRLAAAGPVDIGPVGGPQHSQWRAATARRGKGRQPGPGDGRSRNRRARFLSLLLIAGQLLFGALPVAPAAAQSPASTPSAPQALAAEAGNEKVKLTWEAPSDNGGSAVTGYEYRYAEGASVLPDTNWLSAGTALTATVDSLVNGTQYAFEVRAVNDQGGGDIAAATATPSQNPTVAVQHKQASYSFGEDVTEAGVTILASTGPDARKPSERFFVSVNSEGDSATVIDDYGNVSMQLPFDPGDFSASGTAWTASKTIPLTIVDDSIDEDDETFGMRLRRSPGMPQWVQIRETDGMSDCSIDGCSATVTIEDNDRVASAPQSLAAVRGDGEVTLTWAAPADGGTSTVEGYEYRQDEGATLPEATDETVWTSAGAALTVTVGDLVNGTEYAFELRAVSAAGASEAAAATATPATVPGVPQSFAATPGDGQVELIWQAPASDGGLAITRYEYRHAEGPSVTEATVWQSAGTNLAVTVDSLTNDTEYAFEVRAVNDVGESAVAAIAVAPAAEATAPSVPRALAATPGDGMVTLTWEVPASNGGEELTGYFYRYAEGDSVPAATRWETIEPDTELVVSGLTNGTEYAFELRAENGVGVGEIAGTTATPATLPDAPQGFAATAGNGKAELTWQAPASDGGSAITGYEYRHAAGPSVPETTDWQSAGTNLTATVDSLTNGTEYAFEVRAVNAMGEGEAATATATPLTVPGTPQDLAAEPGNGEVELTWKAPTSNGGSAITGYEYRHAAGPSVPETTDWQSAGTAVTATVDGLTNGTAHAFEVRAVNDAGESEAATATATPRTVPGAPQDLAAKPGVGEVELTWQAPASDGGSAITSYEYRHAAGPSVPETTAWQSAETNLVVTIDSLTNGTAYAFEVRAVNDVGAGEAATVAATPAEPEAPSAPQGLTTKPGNGEVELTWQAPASDGGSAIARYEYRHAEGASVPEATAWQSAGTALTATVDGLANGTAYAFEVRAVNAIGAGDAAETTATPRTVPGAPEHLDVWGDDGAADLYWEPPVDDGGSAVTGYEVRHAEGLSVPSGAAWRSAGTGVELTVGGLTNAVGYAFELRAVNAAGPGPALKATALPVAEPEAPHNVQAIPGDSRITLAWEPPANVAEAPVMQYHYRYAEGRSIPAALGWTKIFYPSVLSVSVDNLVNGTEYTFEIYAVNEAGFGPVATARATPVMAVTAPSAPQALAAEPGDGEVVLTWRAPATDGGSAITRYEYRHAEGTSVPEATAWQSADTNLTVTVDSLANGAEHAFEVRAVNDVGEGDAATATATPVVAATVPSAPQNLAAEPGDGEVVLTWQAPASDGGSAILRYEYRYSEGASVLENTAWQSAETSLTATVGGLANGTEHAFEVRAVNDVGEGDAAAATATPAMAATVPAAPQALATRSGDGQIELTWQAPASDGGSAILRYEYRHSKGAPVPEETAWQSAGTDLTVTVGGLTNATRYAFEVRAVNDVGHGPAVSLTDVPAAMPEAPQELQATPGDSQVTLAWKPPANAEEAAVGVYLYRHAEGSSGPVDAEWNIVDDAHSVTIEGLVNGTAYVFELAAAGGGGTSESVFATATPLPAMAPAEAPSAPRNLVAVPGDGEVSLSWLEPEDSGSEEAVRYEYRFVNGDAGPSGTESSFARQASAPQWIPVGEDRSVTVDDLANGEQYLFEVQAVNDAGASDPATATATPVAALAVDELERHIAGFMLRRANALANNQPGLTRFLKNGETGHSLAAEATEDGVAARGSLHTQNAWLEARTAWSRGGGADSGHLFGAVGAHWRVDDRLLAGLMLQIDLSDEALSDESGSIEGKGWLAGPYFAAQLEGQPLYFEGRLLYGRTDNRYAHATGVSASFETERWLAQFRTEGQLDLEAGLALTPFADLSWIRDSQLPFADSLNRRVEGQAVRLGQAKAGIDFRLRVPTDEGELALVGGVAGIFSATDGGAADAGFAGGRARTDFGIEYRLDDGVSIELNGHYDGLGSSDYGSYGFDSSLKFRF